jgi:dTDP-glucose 4,6-dehydratase
MCRLKNVLVTGGSGFIGSNFIRFLLSNPDFRGTVTNADCLTYAGNPDNLTDIESAFGGSRYFFEKADIRSLEKMRDVFAARAIDTVVHFAAESHVDRSILGPGDFIQTNIVGTFNLLEAARETWGSRDTVRFHHVSTDEVFGSLGEAGAFDEGTPYDPRSPYSASKAASDHLVRAAWHTYGLPVTVSNCSNNYGPRQFPEKLIPLAILNLLEGRPVPVYGDGRNIRDWLFVDEHSRAIWLILSKGQPGRTYTIGGDAQKENIALLKLLCQRVSLQTGKSLDSLERLLTFVKDRPGHDRRYAIDSGRIRRELGWRNGTDLTAGLDSTVRWYRENAQWVQRVRTGEYRAWLQAQYGTQA